MSRAPAVDNRSHHENRLIDVIRHGEALVVRKLSAPYQTRITVVAVLLVFTILLFAAAITASWERPQFRFLLWILGIAVALVTLRMFDLGIYTAKEEVFRFDLGSGTLDRNGEQLAAVTDIDHVLVRRIRRDDNEDPENSDYALVVALQNTKRFTLAETDGVRGARSQIMRAAEEVAGHLGVPVKEGERQPAEYWLDR